MTIKKKLLSTIVFLLIGVILCFEIIRGSMNTGDFIGYVNAGNAVINGQNIYADYLNTWPPFFSIFSVPIAVLDGFSSFLVRFFWLVGSVVAMYYIVNESTKLVFNKSIGFKKSEGCILFQHPLLLIPILIILRYIMDNLANVQINIYMLLCSILSIVFFIKKKYVWVGFLLGLTISLKIYTLFFLFYFIFKREYKPVLWTFIFVALINGISVLVFGYEQAISYYQEWVSEVAPKSYIAHHKNQSVFGMFLRFFTSENPSNDFYVNLLSLDPSLVKKITYIAIFLGALYPAYLLRKKLKNKSSLVSLLEYSLVFTAIPLLSPISWKAYFIFLWVPYFLLYFVLYKANNGINKKIITRLRALYWISVILTVGSAELLVGRYFSDVLEAFSAITIGTIILLFITLILIEKSKKIIQGENLNSLIRV